MCTCMFLTDKEADAERAWVHEASRVEGFPLDGKYIARVTINDPTNPETNGVWYATTRRDFHWALTEDIKHAHPLRREEDSEEAARGELENFVDCLHKHGVRAFKSVELIEDYSPCPLPPKVIGTYRTGWAA